MFNLFNKLLTWSLSLSYRSLSFLSDSLNIPLKSSL
ncbi:hypothetical protein JRYRANMO_CDS_0026 [Salmonella phage FM4b]|nr:hypothetical protein IKARNLZQ_CDS_0026 [Salmonella phage FG1m]WVH07175.1 hypothetical protein JRYRANMO_CDS_0026 [Salmonella phage FM4b]